jgi:hypothetical protein
LQTPRLETKHCRHPHSSEEHCRNSRTPTSEIRGHPPKFADTHEKRNSRTPKTRGHPHSWSFASTRHTALPGRGSPCPSAPPVPKQDRYLRSGRPCAGCSGPGRGQLRRTSSPAPQGNPSRRTARPGPTRQGPPLSPHRGPRAPAHEPRLFKWVNHRLAFATITARRP